MRRSLEVTCGRGWIGVVAAALLFALGGCAGRVLPASEPARASVMASSALEWPADERLRSAGYSRHRGDEAKGALSQESEVAALQAHFAFVIEWLKDREEASLVTAIARRPIFVDAHDTACAVGHLMRADGYREEVERIRREDRFVYLPDAKAGPVLAWVAESGLLFE